MKFEIDQKLAQDILNYLAEKPFKEVTNLVNSLSQLKPIKEEKKEDGKTEVKPKTDGK